MKRIRSLVLDAGALIHAEAHPRSKVVTDCQKLLEIGERPLLPSVVLAQVWRGSSRQVTIAKLRRMCHPVPFTHDVADAVGRLLAMSRTTDVVDAAVVVTATVHDAAILTSDPLDIGKLIEAMGARVPLLTV